jgi:hypothetical protein
VPKVKVEGDELRALMHFPEELGGLSDEIYQAFMAKVLSASSVGFGVEEVKTEAKHREEFGLPPETGWGQGVLFWKQELWELSAVTVPSNPEALAEIKGAGVPTRHLEERLQHDTGFVIEIREPAECQNKCGDTEHGKCGACSTEPEPEPDTLPVMELDTTGGLTAEDMDIMRRRLEAAGYEVVETTGHTPPEPAPAAVSYALVIPDIAPPEPESVQLSVSTLEAVVEEVVSETLSDLVQRAVKKALDYHSGKYVED